ncbi:hypothetical protein [Candidatus Cardinium hertigii]|uniref:Uncharacterized protein n=1 Tax=Candidatus Cardinium hertigii TaxID=247481 RepID=A0A2Z3L9U5_9BACT|nr:hypothetical protein [Candidatus Cardinium hertigii]AWN82283.1 hypothetical protein DK880_00986 [Candidatus Cardinium hertigii]
MYKNIFVFIVIGVQACGNGCKLWIQHLQRQKEQGSRAIKELTKEDTRELCKKSKQALVVCLLWKTPKQLIDKIEADPKIEKVYKMFMGCSPSEEDIPLLRCALYLFCDTKQLFKIKKVEGKIYHPLCKEVPKLEEFLQDKFSNISKIKDLKQQLDEISAEEEEEEEANQPFFEADFDFKQFLEKELKSIFEIRRFLYRLACNLV